MDGTLFFRNQYYHWCFCAFFALLTLTNLYLAIWDIAKNGKLSCYGDFRCRAPVGNQCYDHVCTAYNAPDASR